MEIEKSSLYREIRGILDSDSKPVHYTWEAHVHVNNETIRVMKVMSLDVVRDYEGKYADEMILTTVIPMGTYAKRIYPYQTNLDVTVFKVPIGESSDNVDRETSMQVERYTATLLDHGNPLMEANSPNSPTEENLNLTNLLEVQFQLVNKALEQLRMISVGGIYRSCTIEDVVKGVLTTESKKVQVEGVRMPQGVDMVEATNRKKRDHIVIPQGTKLVNVPHLLQQKCGGIYSSGLGYYLQGDFWYLYPCYDTKRINQAPKTMTIINVPANKFSNVERTYRTHGNNTVVIATGDVKLTDVSESVQLNLGNGARFADATKFMDGFTKTANNRTLISRGANNSEFITTPRENGNNNVHLSDRAITANPFDEYSKLAVRDGSYLTMVWENSNPDLIFPGMMVKVMYLQEDEIMEVQGVVLKAHHYIHLKGQGMMSRRHMTNTSLVIFVQRKPK